MTSSCLIIFVNLIYLSAHYPPHFESFPVELAKNGARVWAVTDLRQEELSSRLRHHIQGHIQVDSLHNYGAVLDKCRRLAQSVGEIHFVESNLESWLDLEAILREDLGVPGLWPQQLQKFKHKSLMKQVFTQAGIPVALGIRPSCTEDVMSFVQQVGFPLILKPDVGVGAQKTYRLNSQLDLDPLAEKISASGSWSTCFLEQHVLGTVESFDGFCDHGGNIVYYTTHTQSAGVREIVHDKLDFYIYSMISHPPDLIEAGFSTIKAFQVKAKFFHLEFFRTPDNRLVGLEINLRPPGGRMLDMMNYGAEIDCYRAWASTLLNNRFPYAYEQKWHCMHISRRENFRYRHQMTEALNKFQDLILTHGELDPASAMAMGKEYVLARSKNLKDLFSLQQFLQARF